MARKKDKKQFFYKRGAIIGHLKMISLKTLKKINYGLFWIVMIQLAIYTIILINHPESITLTPIPQNILK